MSEARLRLQDWAEKHRRLVAVQIAGEAVAHTVAARIVAAAAVHSVAGQTAEAAVHSAAVHSAAVRIAALVHSVATAVAVVAAVAGAAIVVAAAAEVPAFAVAAAVGVVRTRPLEVNSVVGKEGLEAVVAGIQKCSYLGLPTVVDLIVVPTIVLLPLVEVHIATFDNSHHSLGLDLLSSFPMNLRSYHYPILHPTIEAQPSLLALWCRWYDGMAGRA